MPNPFDQSKFEDEANERLERVSRETLELPAGLPAGLPDGFDGHKVRRKWQFFARGLPKGQPRPRAFAFRGRARVYNPATAEGWKQAVAVAATNEGVKGAQGPLAVKLHFQFPRPKAHFGKAGVKDSAPEYHTQKPDTDNLAKAVLDALTQVGAWHDDAQIVELSVFKVWTSDPDRAGAFVELKEV